MLPHELVAAAKAKGIKVTWADVYGLYNRSSLRASGAFVIPTFLTEFIGEYIKDRNVQSILDPWVGIGSPAVSALSNLRIKPHNYAQLVVNPDKAYAGFLAEFFNSALGRMTREEFLSATLIPKISRQNLLTAIVYTFPLDGQKRAVDVSRNIRQLRLDIERLESQLWRRPVDAGKVQKELGRLNEKDSFEAWIETRWVSYHFEKDSDMISPDPSVLMLIREVEQNGNS